MPGFNAGNRCSRPRWWSLDDRNICRDSIQVLMQSMTVIAGLAYSDTRSDSGSRKWTHSLFFFNFIASIGRPSGNPHRTSARRVTPKESNLQNHLPGISVLTLSPWSIGYKRMICPRTYPTRIEGVPQERHSFFDRLERDKGKLYQRKQRKR